jgi:hypothetical protein
MTSRLQNRRDTAANWTSNNPTLGAGEIGYETDTAKYKIGTGSATWTSLSYAYTAGAQGTTGIQGLTGIQGSLGLQGTQGLQGTNTTTATINAQSTNYTLATTDQDKMITVSGLGTQYVSIPTNATAAFPVGSVVHISGMSAGTFTIQAVTSGTTAIQSVGATATAPKLRTQYSAADALKLATDTWLIVGDIS